LFRKAFGNIDQALKTIEKPFFILDSMIVKCRNKPEIEALYQEGVITKETYKLYEETYK